MNTSDHSSGVSIRRSSGSDEYPRLVEIWRSAVDATHDFLAEADRDDIESCLASDYLPQVDLHSCKSCYRTIQETCHPDPNSRLLHLSRRREEHILTNQTSPLGDANFDFVDCSEWCRAVMRLTRLSLRTAARA